MRVLGDLRRNGKKKGRQEGGKGRLHSVVYRSD